MTNVLSLVFGFTIYFLVTLMLTWIFTGLYFRFSKNNRERVGETFNISFALALISFISTFMVLAVYSANLYIYSFLYFVLAAGTGFLYLERRKKIKNIDSAVVVIGLGLILNPIWLSFVGII